MRQLFLTLIGIFFIFRLSGQNCENIKAYKQCEFPEDSRYDNKINWNKTFKFGQTKQYVLTFNKGKEYYISVCARKLDNMIRLRILNDTENKEILYDNAINELSGIIVMDFIDTKKLILEITTPPGKITDESRYLCVGMRIFYKPVNLK